VKSKSWLAALAYIDKGAKSKASVELVVSQPIKELVIATAEQERVKP
jgi:transcriptional regulator of met regulon